MKKQFQSIFKIPETGDQDDIRRKKLLNILLVSMFVLTVIGVIFSGVDGFIKGSRAEDLTLVFVSGPFLMLLIIGIFILNRRYSGKIAGTVFLILLLILFYFTDTPDELSGGRSLFVFVIPITIASLLVSPATSFVFALLSSLEVAYISFSIGISPNYPGIIGFFLLALISWLSSRSLEQALKDLRTVNAELDQRVEDRTQELSEAWAREKIEAEQREAILNSIADGVVVFDRNGVAILANPSITDLLNKSQEQIIGSGLNDLFHSANLKASDRGTLAAILDESVHELSNFRVQFGKKTVSVNASVVRDDNDHPMGTVAVLRDFTHEAELEQMKNTFIAIVSHELRTPLNAILGYAEMLKEAVYGQVNEKQQNVSGRIMTNAQRLLGIVSDLLDQAQIEAGKLKIQMTPFKPIELLDNMRGVMDKIVADKKIELITELDSAMPTTIIGDPQRLQQIMVNLTNNAVKFTEQGIIRVKIYPSEDGQYWHIQTLDTGSGIPEDAKEYIFDTFRQVDGASTRQHGGVGLGLSIVKQLVDLMGGKVMVESEVGKGSTFTVILPLLADESRTVPLKRLD